MRRAAAFLAVTALVASAAATYVLTHPASAAAEDLNLGGRIYDCNNSLITTAMPFTVHVNHSGVWQSFVAPYNTDNGYYAFTLNYSLHNAPGLGWLEGEQYYIEVTYLGVPTRTVSHGTGSANAFSGNPEYSGLGNYTNLLYWTSGDVDNWQFWDVQLTCVDLEPINLVVDGLGYGAGAIIDVTGGTSHTVNIDVRNNGNTPLNESFWLRFNDSLGWSDWQLLADDLLTTAPLIGALSTIGPFSALWTAPLLPGTYPVCITVDATDRVVESNEGNNVLCFSFRVLGPDLIVEPVGIQPTGQARVQYAASSSPVIVYLDLTQDVALDFRALNNGSAWTGTAFDVDVTVCGGATLSSNPGLPALLPAASSALLVYTWINPGIPQIISLCITADAGGDVIEQDEANNTFRIDLYIEGPDLIPTNLNVEGLPRNAGDTVDVSPGQVVDVTVQVENLGNRTAGASTATRTVNLDADNQPVGVLGPFATSGVVVFATWTAPSSGTYQLCVDVDSGGVVVEEDETNNQICVTIRVMLPDLVIGTVQYTIDSLGPVVVTNPPPTLVINVDLGQDVYLNFTARNDGPATTGVPGTFRIGLYDNTGVGGNPADCLSVAAVVTGPLGPLNPSPDETTLVGAYVWNNPNLAGTTYTICLYVDDDGQVLENSETNNFFNITIAVAIPDLITIVDNIPANVRISTPVDLVTHAENPGFGGFAADFANRIETRDALNVLVGPFYSNQVHPGLIAGGVASQDTWAGWFQDEEGTYTVTVCSDVDGNVSEGSEANNCETRTIAVAGPDLRPYVEINGTPAAPRPASLNVGVGDVVNVDVYANNSGSLDAGTSFTLILYDCDPTWTTCVEVARMEFANLLPGISQLGFTFVVPTPGPDDFYLRAVIDTDGNVTEEDETGPDVSNNVFEFIIFVGGLPDLEPASATVNGMSVTDGAPVTIVSGQPVTFTVHITNAGQSPAGAFDVEFADTRFNFVFGTAAVAGLLPGGNSPALTATWLANTQTGAYTVRICADRAALNPPVGDVVESDDSDASNCWTFAFNVLSLPEPPTPFLEVAENDVELRWSPIPGVGLYWVYKGPLATELDLATRVGIATDTGVGDIEFTDTGGATATEGYYVVRSVIIPPTNAPSYDANGWGGPTSRTVGFYKVAFPAGWSSFSLPLEPFVERRASSYIGSIGDTELDALYGYDEALQQWTGHARFQQAGVADFDVAMGKLYMVYVDQPATYAFTGVPAANIRFLDGVADDARIGSEGNFRTSVAASMTAGDLDLTWMVPPTPAQGPYDTVLHYRVFKSLTRDGFNTSADCSATPMDEDDGCAIVVVPLGQTPAFTDRNYTGGSAYYLVVPYSGRDAPRSGSSAYSIGVDTRTVPRQWSTYAPIVRTEPMPSPLLYGTGPERELDAFYVYHTPLQQWIGHAKFSGGITVAVTYAAGVMAYSQAGGVTITTIGR